jgi:hypothetical protein
VVWAISSPHASKGELFETYRCDYGPEGDRLIMVAKAASRTMNGTLPESHHGFCDPSGGSRDSMTLAIGHNEQDRVILDVVLEIKPPFSPDAAVEQFARVLSVYRQQK